MKQMQKDASTSQQQRKQMQSRDVKKSIGSFYTPQNLASHITNETLNAWLIRRAGLDKLDERNITGLNQGMKKNLLNLLRDIRILDPAVGGGAFLLSAADWLNQMRMVLGDSFTSFERRCDIAMNSLYGVDLVGDAIIVCKQNLHRWCNSESVGKNSFKIRDLTKIRKGNSLVGFTNQPFSHDEKRKRVSDLVDPFQWFDEFAEVLQSSEPGFDVILGNPPYGNILDTHVRQYIKETYPMNVGGGKDGTWNSAAHFIVRSRALMKEGSYLGFLVPNSILRVNQFSKTRRFILDKMNLWKIIDEGSPFDDVTLEMVSLFCEISDDYVHDQIEIESRRPGHEQINRIDRKVLRSGKVFSIYHDTIFSKILSRGARNLLTASRGRDIPKEHVSREKSRDLNIPYITSGRSVKRYQILEQHQSYTDDWFKQDSRLRESFESELLVATK
ncbi:MAG: Eco57I restriction-modification methylase domain-containing protein, partial [Candidatus Odinarchaeota archaeon]